MYPGVQSGAVVPVGLTRHRAKLPDLAPVTPEIAAQVLTELNRIGDNLKKSLGTRFVYPADEFYLLAGERIPPESFYDEFPQVENGVGMVRQLLDSAPVDRIKLKSKLAITIATGELISDILDQVLREKWAQAENLEFNVSPVHNRLLGESVTVSNLLCGRDIADAVSNAGGDIVVVPPDCLNDDGLFLDDLTLNDVSSRVGRPAVQADYSPADTLNKIVKEFAS
jgi:NifB/MoaA-like Fe-S oxidoreductase